MANNTQLITITDYHRLRVSYFYVIGLHHK